MNILLWRPTCVAAVVGLLACSSPPVPECTSSTQCTFIAGGDCATSPTGHKWCLYPDPLTCPGGTTGQRWSSEAGEGLASQCLAAYQLTVDFTGGGGGTVTSKPDGISCDGAHNCAAAFADSTSVTLSATPDGNSRFMGWSDAGATCGTASTCTVGVTAATKVSSTFVAIPSYDLIVTKAGTGQGTVTSEPTGIACGSVCQTQFREGSSVTLRAEAGTKSAFRAWTGACSSFGSNATCTIDVNAVTAVTATFDAIPDYSIVVTLDGAGQITSDVPGINCTQNCVATFQKGTQVTLTAAPSGDSTFQSWGGDASSCAQNTTCKLTVSQTLNVTASFKKPPTLSVILQGSAGSVTLKAPSAQDVVCTSNCTATYKQGTVISLSATPGTLSEFSGWSQDASSCGKMSPCSLTISSDKAVSATFTSMPALTLDIQGSGTGSVSTRPAGIQCPGTCTAQFPTGTQVALVASAAPGSTFTGWLGNPSCGVNATCSTTLSASTSAVARFTESGTTLWLTDIGGPGFEAASAVAVSPNGDAFVSGYFRNSEKIAGMQLTNKGSDDIFLAKLSRDDGHISWIEGFGGSGLDFLSSVAVEPTSGDVYLMATYVDTANFGGVDLPGDDDGDFVFGRYSAATGALVWPKPIRIVSNNPDHPKIAASSDAIVLVGTWYGDIDLGDGTTRSAPSPGAMFVAKYDLNGTIIWGQDFPITKTATSGGVTSVGPTAVRIDQTGNVIVVGGFNGELNFGTHPQDALISANEDGFLVKLHGSDGSHLWSRIVGGPSIDHCDGLALGPQDAIVVACNSETGDSGQLVDMLDYGGPSAPPGPLPTSDFDVVVAQYSSLNDFAWAQRFGGPLSTTNAGDQIVVGVGVDKATDRVLATGYYSSVVKIGDVTLPQSGQYQNSWTASLNWQDGSTIWADRFGGVGFVTTSDVAIDEVDGRIIVVGGFDSLAQFGTFEDNAIGMTDGFGVCIVPVLTH